MMAKNEYAINKNYWGILALALLIGIACLPTPEGLSVAGQRVLAILAFAIIMWVTEAVSYPCSAVAIISFIILLIGFSLNADGSITGTVKAIPVALSGFINPGWVLGTAGLFMAAGMLSTGMDKRIALNILKVVGVKVNSIFAGLMIVMLVLDFFIPAVSARSATMTPIAVGLIGAFGVNPKSTFSRMLLVTVALSSSISGIGLLTAGSPNPVAQYFIQNTLNIKISWGDWFIYAMPYCVALMGMLYLLITRMNKFEFDEIPGGRVAIARALSDLGPMTGREKRISGIFLLTIIMWTTESWHKIDANTIAVMSVGLMLSPVIGVASWEELCSRVDWGTILLFAAGISLGSALLDTGAALWLAKTALGGLVLKSFSPEVMLIVIVLALIIVRFAFSSITSATAALVPTVLGFLIGLGNAALPIWGMTLIATFTMYFGFILPINSPQAIIAYSTNTFEVKDLVKIGVPLTFGAIILMVVFIYTYWHWLGLLDITR